MCTSGGSGSGGYHTLVGDIHLQNSLISSRKLHLSAQLQGHGCDVVVVAVIPSRRRVLGVLLLLVKRRVLIVIVFDYLNSNSKNKIAFLSMSATVSISNVQITHKKKTVIPLVRTVSPFLLSEKGGR